MCGVQSHSKCVKEGMDRFSAARKSNAPLQPADVPSLYCHTGRATCQDIDLKSACICPSCPVFKEYSLKGGTPRLFYCRDGAASA